MHNTHDFGTINTSDMKSKHFDDKSERTFDIISILDKFNLNFKKLDSNNMDTLMTDIKSGYDTVSKHLQTSNTESGHENGNQHIRIANTESEHDNGNQHI